MRSSEDLGASSKGVGESSQNLHPYCVRIYYKPDVERSRRDAKFHIHGRVREFNWKSNPPLSKDRKMEKVRSIDTKARKRKYRLRSIGKGTRLKGKGRKGKATCPVL